MIKEVKNKNREKIYSFFLIAMIIFVLDHFLKIIAIQKKCFFICLSFVKNYGAAFSLFSRFSQIIYLLIFISFIVIILTTYFYFKYYEKSKFLRWGFSLVFAGTFSNLIDRIFFGYIIDYIPFISKNFFTFNLADVFKFVGVIFLIVFFIKKD